jgi:hypothetical protein
MNRFPVLLLAACAALPAWAGGDPSDGHTHGPLETAPIALDAPRATAHSEDFELVVVPAAGELRLYLDRYDTNAPVAGARIEVESGAVRATAREAEAGLYTVPGEAFTAPGRHPLSVTIETDTTADLLAATLEITAAAPLATATAFPRWAIWAGTGGLLGAAAIAMLRRRRQGNTA